MHKKYLFSLYIKIKEIYDNFQSNMAQFAKRYKQEINSDSKFRDKFSDMCQEFDVNPMMGMIYLSKSIEKHLD